MPLYFFFFLSSFSNQAAAVHGVATRVVSNSDHKRNGGGDDWKQFEINESFEREREREVVRIIRSNSGDFTKFLRLSRGEQVRRTVALGYPGSQFVAKVSRGPRAER